MNKNFFTIEKIEWKKNQMEKIERKNRTKKTFFNNKKRRIKTRTETPECKN